MPSNGESNGIKKAAAFLGGFILPFPVYIVVNFSSFAVERFHLPPNKIPLFINKFFSSMEISCLVGMMLTCAAVVVLDDNSYILSIVNIWLFFIIVATLFISYISGGDFGDVSLYYWMVNMLGFVLGYNYISSAKVSSNDGLLVILGRSLSGILVVIYQMGFYYIGSYYGLEDLGHRMFIWFFILLIIVSLSAAITWTIGYNDGSGSKNKPCKCTSDSSGTHSCCKAKNKKCCCCCKMCNNSVNCSCEAESGDDTCCEKETCCCCCKKCVVCIKSCNVIVRICSCIKKKCLIVICLILTAISNMCSIEVEFKVCYEDKCCFCCVNGKPCCDPNNCTCCSSSDGSIGELSDPNAISALLMFPISNPIAYSFNPSIAPYQFLGLVDGYKVSLLVTFTTCIPSCVFTAINETKSTKSKGPKNKWTSDLAFYNMAWCAMLPLLTAAVICLIMLHYPYCRISRYFYGSKFRIFLLSIALQLSNEVMLGIGMGGVGSQGSGNNGTLTALSLLLAFLTLVIGMFISDGYLRTYRKADRDHWPTKGYTRYRGFKFWFGSGVKEAKRTFREVFTLDMRKLLISYE